MTDDTKIWTTYGIFDEYIEVTKKIHELGEEYDLFKIKLLVIVIKPSLTLRNS